MKILPLGSILGIALMMQPAMAQDPGRDEIGMITVTVLFGTDGDPEVAGGRARELGPELRKLLEANEKLKFRHYRLLGSEAKPLFRSYENWAQPIAGSEEILCRFEIESRVSAEAKRINLELWLSRKKILKTGVVLTTGKPLLILGPDWRGGHLIILAELAPPLKKGQ